MPAVPSILKCEDVPDDAICKCGHVAEEHKHTKSVGWTATGCLNHDKIGYCKCEAFDYQTIVNLDVESKPLKPWASKKKEPKLEDLCKCGHNFGKHGFLSGAGCLHHIEDTAVGPKSCMCEGFEQKMDIKFNVGTGLGSLKYDDLVAGDNVTVSVSSVQSITKSLKAANVMLYKGVDIYGGMYMYNDFPPTPLKKDFPKTQIALAKKFLDEAGLPAMTLATYSLEEIMLSFMGHTMEAVIQDRIAKAVDIAKGERRKNVAPIMRKNDRKFRKG